MASWDVGGLDGTENYAVQEGGRIPIGVDHHGVLYGGELGNYRG